MEGLKIKQIKLNIEALKGEKEKLVKQQQIDYKRISELQQHIQTIEKEEQSLKESVAQKESQMAELLRVIEESQYSYDKLDSHINQVNQVLEEELQNLK